MKRLFLILLLLAPCSALADESFPGYNFAGGVPPVNINPACNHINPVSDSYEPQHCFVSCGDGIINQPRDVSLNENDPGFPIRTAEFCSIYSEYTDVRNVAGVPFRHRETHTWYFFVYQEEVYDWRYQGAYTPPLNLCGYDSDYPGLPRCYDPHPDGEWVAAWEYPGGGNKVVYETDYNPRMILSEVGNACADFNQNGIVGGVDFGIFGTLFYQATVFGTPWEE
jgi:hypothetical protein